MRGAHSWKGRAFANYEAHSWTFELIVPTMSSSALIIDYELLTMSYSFIMKLIVQQVQ